MIRQGFPDLLGATPDATGTNFAVYSGCAERVELCLLSATGQETARYTLPDYKDGIWYGFLPDCPVGQLYGYRVHGRYDPAVGLRSNPGKLLLDPYARQMHGELEWASAVFDFQPGHPDREPGINLEDSAPFVPKSVVVGDTSYPAKRSSPRIGWADTVIYELNVRGFTMRHPGVPAIDRGTFRGMRNGEILRYLKALGITSIELMPVQAFIDEQFLVRRGLRNFWGYNTIGFFAPANRYLAGDSIAAFRDMVDAIHDQGMEVILDVAYNHTGESDSFGPALCFRGLDNLAYYRTVQGKPGEYINDTGCGNTLNADHPIVHRLVLDSLRYWHRQMGADGFRFDLATVLGRSQHGYNSSHPLLQAIATDAGLRNVKLIAEPWDPGPGGYQLGHFPAPWAEWNDRFRDAVRRSWRGDSGQSGELAKRLHGSADVFEAGGRKPWASVNFIASHDGFTLADSVSYLHRHNEENGESNQDGHSHNFSCNHGVEGPSDDPAIVAARRTHRLNMLATLLLSQGTPMLLAGDEFGNSQEGNNNAYAQDNETGWLDWPALDADPEFQHAVSMLVHLRRTMPLVRGRSWLHGFNHNPAGWRDIEWRNPAGGTMQAFEWDKAQAFALLLAATDTTSQSSTHAIAILLNADNECIGFCLPAVKEDTDWQLVFSTVAHEKLRSGDGLCSLPAGSLAVFKL